MGARCGEEGRWERVEEGGEDSKPVLFQPECFSKA